MKANKLAKLPFDPSKFPLFYGWLIIPLGTIGMLMSAPGQTVGVATFTDSLIEALGISRNNLSLAYMFGTIGSSFMLTWAGKKYDKYGVRVVGAIAASMLALVLVYLSFSLELVNFLSTSYNSDYIAFGILLVGFLFLRFFGQGVLTLVSRNMVMKWFDSYRGIAAGINNASIAYGFSLAPLVFEALIISFGWQGAWLSMALIIGIVMPIVILIFFRDNPESCGLEKDGGLTRIVRSKKDLFKVYRDFSLQEARSTLSYWIFALFLAFQGLYITGFLFNVTSVFEKAGLTREQALNIFVPSATIGLGITFLFSAISDYLRLKVLLFIMGVGAFCSTLAIVYLGYSEFFYYQLIFGNAVMIGLFGVITSTVWPRFYGNTNLGAISGSALTMVVFASALGPIIFSSSLTFFDSYSVAGWFCFAVYFVLTTLAFKADNPQEKLKPID